MTPFRAQLEQAAEEHQRGIDEVDGLIGDKTLGLIAYHKFIAGGNFGYHAALNSELVKGLVDNLDCWCETSWRANRKQCTGCDAKAAYSTAIKEREG